MAQGPFSIPAASVTRLGWIDAAPVRWLWPGRVPTGALTLLTGDPGVGKSMLTLDIAARVTTGRGWPDGQAGMSQPHEVLYIGGEDDLATTVRPRLEAAGGDPAMVKALQGIRNEKTGYDDPFHLRKHQASLKHIVENSPIVLVIIDPLWAHLPGSGSANEVRAVMAGLSYMAQAYNIAFLAVTHLNKRASIRAMYRSSGHTALIAATRCAHLVAREPGGEGSGDDPIRDDSTWDDGRRVMLPVKNNLYGQRPGLAFRVTDKGIAWEPNRKVAATADGALDDPESSRRRRAGEVAAARQLLSEILAGGPVASTEVFRAAEARGWSRTRVRDAAIRSGVRFRKHGNSGPWMWEVGEIESVRTPVAIASKNEASVGDGAGESAVPSEAQ